MKHLLIILILYYFNSICSAQVIKGRVISGENGKGVAYASVLYPEILKGTIADSLGYFQIERVAMFKNILISAVGFSNKLVPVEEISLNPIKLETREYQMNEFSVSGHKSIELLIGCNMKNPHSTTFNLGESNESKIGFHMYFPRNSQAKMKSIGLYINKVSNPKTKLHFRILEPDTTFKTLGTDQLKTDLWIGNLKHGWNEIELTNEDVRFSKYGIIVSFYFTEMKEGDILIIPTTANDPDYSWMSSTDYRKDFSFGPRKVKPALRINIIE